MLDMKFIRENPKLTSKSIKDRGYDINTDELLKLDEKYRKNLQKTEKLKHQRNIATDEIRQLKKQGKNISKQIKEIQEIPEKIKKIDDEIDKLRKKIFDIALAIPNISDNSVPVGLDEF